MHWYEAPGRRRIHIIATAGGDKALCGYWVLREFGKSHRRHRRGNDTLCRVCVEKRDAIESQGGKK